MAHEESRDPRSQRIWLRKDVVEDIQSEELMMRLSITGGGTIVVCADLKLAHLSQKLLFTPRIPQPVRVIRCNEHVQNIPTPLQCRTWEVKVWLWMVMWRFFFLAQASFSVYFLHVNANP